MKKKILYFSFLLLSNIFTILICFFIIKSFENNTINGIKQVQMKSNKIQQGDSENNCSLEYVIYTYEHLFDDGKGSNAARYNKYKKEEAKTELNNFIKEVQENFSDDNTFLNLFNYNLNTMKKLSEKNIEIFYPAKDYDTNFVNHVSPFSRALKTGSEYGFILGELNYLYEFLSAYCHTRQDNEGCIKMVFDKK